MIAAFIDALICTIIFALMAVVFMVAIARARR